jgi:signal transduction histidine kinase
MYNAPMNIPLCRRLLTAGIACALGSAMAEDRPPITNIPSIRSLSGEEGASFLPVKLDATVTFYHPDWGVLFVHDGQSGICVGLSVEHRPARPFQPGIRLHIEGVAGPGEFLPVVLPDRLEENDTSSAIPTYQPVTAEQFLEPGLDGLPVEVQATVKGTWFGDQSLVVELEINGMDIKAVLPQQQAQQQLPWQLVERRVRVRGIAGTHFNDQRQMSGRLLFVQDLASFIPDEEAQSVAEVPLLPVTGLLRVHSPLRQRVRVQGVVTHIVTGRGLYLRGEDGSMFVQTAQPIAVAIGDRVEADGYPAVTAFRPSLSAINVAVVGKTEPPLPYPFIAAQTRHSREQCELVRLDANLLEMTRHRDGTSLLCAVDGETFEALLAEPTQLPPLEPGMKLGLTGICEFASTRPLVIPRNATGFSIQLRDSTDVQVLASPPWWNSRRVLWVLGIVGAAAALIGSWAVVLQIMVQRQSSVIRLQTQHQAAMEERQRIARDLHDTLEQELVGVTMLLDTTAKKMHGGQPQAGETLNLARRLLRRVRQDSRSTIRELRSVTLEKRGLASAMEELLRPLATVSGATFSVQVQGTPIRLTGMVETHLLRLAQEAVANAAQHAGGTSIQIRLCFEPSQVTLEVADDGRGFDKQTAGAPEGHFGLSGMKERTDKMNGSLRILSEPGRGTTIHVTVPLSTSSPTNPLEA